MKASPDCIPYTLARVLSTARLVTEDEWIHRKVLLKALNDLSEDTSFEKSAPETIFSAITAAYKALGVKDPYENEKARLNRIFLALEKDYRQEIDASGNAVGLALEFACAGSAVTGALDERSQADVLIKETRGALPVIDGREELLASLEKAESVLYVLNNAGEAVLDKLFIEKLAENRKVTVVVRSTPILNDVTADDAVQVGLDKLNVEIVDPGSSMLGLSLEKVSNELRESFKTADLVICKGQANYETLCDCDRNVFFMLCARSAPIARRLSVDAGSVVAFNYQPEKTSREEK